MTSRIFILALVILTVFASTVFASTAFADDVLVEEMRPQPFYYSFTGTVKEIQEQENGYIRVFIVDEEGLEANFMLSEDTFYLDDVKITVGKEITGYYEAGRPMILIYPPQYTIDIVSPVYEDIFVKVDKFDSNLLSKDGMLKLNISETTEILWENNVTMNWFAKPSIEDLEHALSNRKLIVFYDVTTRSIPPQTSPKKVLVLSEQEIDPILIMVDGTLVEAPEAYINEDNIVMVPIRAISELLGYEVTWNNDERSVSIGSDIYLKIGENKYTFSESQVELETAPIIKNDYTYVPLSFFKQISNVYEETLFQHNIVISNEPLTGH